MPRTTPIVTDANTIGRCIQLADVSIMRSLSGPFLRALERGIVRVPLNVREDVPFKLTAPDHLFIVRRGRVGLVTETGERTSVIPMLLESGDVYSTLGHARCGKLSVLEDAMISPVPATVVAAIGRHCPEFMCDLAGELSRQVAVCRDAAANFAQSHVNERLWSRLVAITEQMGTATTAGAQLRIPLTHAQWAMLTGTSRESVTIALGRLKRERRIRTDGRLITIPWEELRVADERSGAVGHVMHEATEQVLEEV